MLVKNVFTKVLNYFKSLRFSWVYARDTGFVVVPLPIVFVCRQGICFGFMWLFWQIGFQFSNEI